MRHECEAVFVDPLRTHRKQGGETGVARAFCAVGLHPHADPALDIR
jgi:hypothetical protein